MAFNLNKLATKDVSTVEILDPTTELPLLDEKGNAVTVDLFGPGSMQYRNAVNALQNRALKRGKKQMSPELLRSESIELLSSAIAGSSGNIEYNGEIVKTKDQWVELLSDSNLDWLRNQIAEAQGELENFLPK